MVVKNKGTIIRGKELNLTERDVYKSLSFFGKIDAFFFGGLYSIGEVESKDLSNRGVLLYIPPIHERFYWKVLYRFTHRNIKKINLTKMKGSEKNE